MNYQFRVTEEGALGTLKNGNSFIIDAELIERFCGFSWSEDRDGYIRASNHGKSPIMLHRWVVGITDECMIVDHINRDRHDCRKSNLRVINVHQNAMNHGFFRTNKSGYIGVYYSKSSMRYEAKVGYRGKRIFLGSSKNNTQELAQMYNIAASFLYGEYTGVLNNVPLPTYSLVRSVEDKCKKYKVTATVISFVNDVSHNGGKYDHKHEYPANPRGQAEAREIQPAQRPQARRLGV